MNLLCYLKLRELTVLSIAVVHIQVVVLLVVQLAFDQLFFSEAFSVLQKPLRNNIEHGAFDGKLKITVVDTDTFRNQQVTRRPLLLLASSTTSSQEDDDDVNNGNNHIIAENESIPTNHSKRTFAFANSLHGRLLCASQCAYLEPKDLKQNLYFVGAAFLPGTSVRRLAPRSGLDACLVGRTVDGIVVAFRGTLGNAVEWLQNASIYLRRVPKSYAPKGSRVHEGFYGALRGRFEAGVKTAILELLQEEQQEGQGRDSREPTKIYVTGHSKGGSLASLFALMLHNDPNIPSPESVCSFGAAKVGNPAFAMYFNSVVNQTTYENHLDIIPFLPPGETTMEDIQTATDDPEAMMEMIESILGPELTTESETNPSRPFRRIPFLRRAGNRRFWNYNPIGNRTYIDPTGSLLNPVPRDLDVQRLLDLEGTSFRDLRRAHCSSCSDDYSDDDDDDDDDDENVDEVSSTCSGGYFAALAPEICDSAIG